MPETPKPQVTEQERRVLTDSLGVTDDSESVTVTDLRADVETETSEEFRSVRLAVREDLSGELDPELIDEALAELSEQLDRLAEIRAAGIPDGETEAEEVYRELIEPAWEAYDHLADVGFFESLDSNLPAFTEEAIETTAGQLIASEKLMAGLSDNAFDEHEQTVLLSNVVNNKTRLSRWVPTKDIPEGVEFDVEYIPPLHQRSMGGALLWVNALDDHLWRKEILVTEEILDDAYWYTKAILAGLYTMMRGARAFASDDGDLDDAEATAALLGGSALTIVNQEEMMKDVFWINEEDRAPSPAR
jgi:hypothetical protein